MAPPKKGERTFEGVDSIREAAVQRAIDPISLDDLRGKSSQVGALILDGHRVEQALYHRSSVVDANDTLRVRNDLSPVTGELVDGFLLAPPLANLQDFIQFLDWNHDGWLSVSEVAIALAALLPVDEDATEHFIRDHFDVDQDGLISEDDLRENIQPYCNERLAELLAAAPPSNAPELHRGATKEELQEWFDHWDTNDSGDISLEEFRFAIAWTLYHALGDSVDILTKETVAGLFLTETNIRGDGHIEKNRFVELFAPALQANMPERTVTKLGATKSHEVRSGQCEDEIDAKQPMQFVLHAPLTGKTVELDKSSADTLADLRKAACEEFACGPLQLYCNGHKLASDGVKLGSVPGLRSGAVLQVLPEVSGAMCVIS